MTDHDHIHHDNRDDARFQPDDHPRLGPLSKFGDFEVADGYRDPRGWRVVAADGTDVGKVHDLIVDTGTMHTRYLDLRLDHDRIPSAAGRPTDDWDALVPVSAVQLDADHETVKLPSINPAQLVSFPVYNHGEITTEYENAVLGGVGAAAAAATAAGAHAEHTAHTEHVDREAQRARAAAPAAATVPPATVPPTTNATDTRAVNAANAAGVPADLLNQPDVTVERRAVDPHEATDANVKPVTSDNEVRVPVVSEETVTRPIIREEIVIRRHGLAGDRTNTSANTNAAPGTTGDVRKA